MEEERKEDLTHKSGFQLEVGLQPTWSFNPQQWGWGDMGRDPIWGFLKMGDPQSSPLLFQY